MQDMVDKYKQTKRVLRALRTLNTDRAEREVIGGMISDCEYVLEWLRTGRRPGNRRGIERRAAYQRECPTDPAVLHTYLVRTSADRAESIPSVSDRDRGKLEKALSILTKRERECYCMVVGQRLPFSEAALLLGIKKGSVQWFVESARKKLKNYDVAAK
ncbi:hypothetical protein KQI79_24470 [Paenibacillus sp. MSJ-34]|nr:sigma factor-like helix-turn-helix DNA-binding protein [Paenibacillus sp. CECT 9249]MBU5445179.1 hypothetical protein [Paenibacillus sp. MSJ-34]